MKFNSIMNSLALQRAEQLSAELEGQVMGSFEITDQHGPCFEFCGHCHKVHPDVAHIYPKGWGLMQTETVDEVLEHLGLSITLTEV